MFIQLRSRPGYCHTGKKKSICQVKKTKTIAIILISPGSRVIENYEKYLKFYTLSKLYKEKRKDAKYQC